MSPIRTFRWDAVLCALAMSGTACDDPMNACTLIGCADGITVRLEGTVPAEYTVTVSSPTAETLSRTCTTAAPCAGGAVRFDQYAPAEVTIAVEWSGGAVTVSVQPAYQVSHPNGPRCPPECREATITLGLA